MTDSYRNTEDPKDKGGATTPGVGSSTVIRFNPNNETEMNGNKRSPLVALAHEISQIEASGC